MGYWDLLDYGQYYQNGYRPVEYSAYERSYMGWLDVKELGDEAQHATLFPLTDRRVMISLVLMSYAIRIMIRNITYLRIVSRTIGTVR